MERLFEMMAGHLVVWGTIPSLYGAESNQLKNRVREVIADQTDEFINDYLAANPR